MFLRAAVLVSLVVCSSLGLLSVPFGYAWRFRDGDDPGVTASSPVCAAFPHRLAEFDCTHLERDPNRFTASDCEAACCYSLGCRVWVWNRTVIPHCYHGTAASVCGASPNRTSVGARRSTDRLLRSNLALADTVLDDSSWQIVDAPHDSLINATYAQTADHLHGHLPRNVSWYRKHFSLPPAWQKDGSTVRVHFEGVFHFAMVWLNGVFLGSHSCGYTGFTVRLDNVSAAIWGTGNVLSVRADATYGSGHWYEGGGVYRPVYLERLAPVHFVHNGVFVDPQPRGGSAATRAQHIFVSTELQNYGPENSTVRVRMNLFDSHGRLVASNSTASFVVESGAGQPRVHGCMLRPARIQLWSERNPALHTAEVLLESIVSNQRAGTLLDSANITIGFRSLSWTPDHGLYVNSQQLKLQGFSNHDSFAGVGTAVPDRINLFRVQMLRALGGNVWRMSHNPYSSSVYKLLDTLGVLAWDESRDFSMVYIDDMQDMVKRDRNHACVAAWSVCNEYECNQVHLNATQLAFQAKINSLDGGRPTAANTKTSYSFAGIDLLGFSHGDIPIYQEFHSKHPQIPLVLSECCSCTSQRIGNSRVEGSCMHDQNTAGQVEFNAGSLGVWTLFDYQGEPEGTWPSVSSSFGQLDLAGFPKPHAYWYEHNWLASKSGFHLARVLDLLDRPAQAGPNANANGTTLTTITSTAASQLIVDGRALPAHTGAQGNATQWHLPRGAKPPKNVTLLALRGDGTAAASHTVLAPSVQGASRLRLSVDVPSPLSNTGSARC